jgi:hypothetical protein
MMLAPIPRTALPVLVASTLALQVAYADIYTWADASGSVNVGNLAPPDGARVIRVTRTSAADVARENAARDAARRAETQALEERVRQLEEEVSARRQAPPQVVYRDMPVPPAQYRIDPAPPPVHYTIFSSAPAYAAACDPGWMACGLGWFSTIHPTGVVFVRAPTFRRFPSIPVSHHFVARPPMRSFRGVGRG